ncbi:hypothetical protein R3P38DRAFT_3460136 [Favolaschia claudopus]|uniref:Uncharacterized protein n=1 Tax=Favolaschia claudopus TaxID=2862362 RepID=A0AAV9ZGX7_9AGAR
MAGSDARSSRTSSLQVLSLGSAGTRFALSATEETSDRREDGRARARSRLSGVDKLVEEDHHCVYGWHGWWGYVPLLFPSSPVLFVWSCDTDLRLTRTAILKCSVTVHRGQCRSLCRLNRGAGASGRRGMGSPGKWAEWAAYMDWRRLRMRWTRKRRRKIVGVGVDAGKEGRTCRMSGVFSYSCFAFLSLASVSASLRFSFLLLPVSSATGPLPLAVLAPAAVQPLHSSRRLPAERLVGPAGDPRLGTILHSGLHLRNAVDAVFCAVRDGVRRVGGGVAFKSREDEEGRGLLLTICASTDIGRRDQVRACLFVLRYPFLRLPPLVLNSSLFVFPRTPPATLPLASFHGLAVIARRYAFVEADMWMSAAVSILHRRLGTGDGAWCSSVFDLMRVSTRASRSELAERFSAERCHKPGIEEPASWMAGRGGVPVRVRMREGRAGADVSADTVQLTT